MSHPDHDIETGNRIISMLERLSADSYWAHQASGVRGALLRYLEPDEALARSMKSVKNIDEQLQLLIEMGFYILEKAAREINVPNKHYPIKR